MFYLNLKDFWEFSIFFWKNSRRNLLVCFWTSDRWCSVFGRLNKYWRLLVFRFLEEFERILGIFPFLMNLKEFWGPWCVIFGRLKKSWSFLIFCFWKTLKESWGSLVFCFRDNLAEFLGCIFVLRIWKNFEGAWRSFFTKI